VIVKKKILITGASGFIGSNLVKYLSCSNYEIVAFKGDLIEKNSCINFIEKNLPFDIFIHLAGVSYVPEGEDNIARLFAINVAGTCIVAEAIAKYNPIAHLFFASSAQVYKAPELPVKLSENSELIPQNVYARSKLICEHALLGYSKDFNIKTTVLRFFNHTHKSQRPEFFLPSLYLQCQQAIQSKKTSVKLSVGNLNVTRDISPVSNVVEAINKIISFNERLSTFEVFNICSGNGVNLMELTNALTSYFDLEMIADIDPTKVRIGDPQYIVGDDTKLRNFLCEPNTLKRDLNWLINGFLKDL
jgi:nucleoside-diphosphate-sugar epimerase